MKKLFIIFLSVMFSLGASAQMEAIDLMLKIQTEQKTYITAMVDIAVAGSMEKARYIGKLKLFEEVAKQMVDDIPEDSIVKHMKELEIKGKEASSLFVYVKKSSLKPASKPIPNPSPESDVKDDKPAPLPKVVSFRFTGESFVGADRKAMENNISKLLCAINEAYSSERTIDTHGINMTDDCRESIQMGWKHKPYYCVDAENVKICMRASENMTVRDIPVYSKNDDNHNRNISIAFNAKGQIECVRFAADIASYEKIMRNGGKEITDAVDAARRTSILSFVENYRNYYIKMDIANIEKVFADDAIIITGSVMRTVKKSKGDKNKVVIDPVIVYNKKKKEEYMASLKKLFANNKEINVQFDEIRVIQDPIKKDFYGVTLKQKWDSKSKAGGHYNDVGYVFLLWDFKIPEQPQIHVRTWQPAEVINKEEDILGLNSFRY